MFSFKNKSNTKPITGQSAPTTATAGYLGEVRFDTDGNEWKLIKIDGGTYYWAPDCFPADNTEYPAYVENGVVVWKAAITGITPNSTSSNQEFISSIASGAGYEGLLYQGVVYLSSGVSRPLPTALSTTTDAVLVDSHVVYTDSFVMIYFKLNAALINKPFNAYISYTK